MSKKMDKLDVMSFFKGMLHSDTRNQNQMNQVYIIKTPTMPLSVNGNLDKFACVAILVDRVQKTSIPLILVDTQENIAAILGRIKQTAIVNSSGIQTFGAVSVSSDSTVGQMNEQRNTGLSIDVINAYQLLSGTSPGHASPLSVGNVLTVMGQTISMIIEMVLDCIVKSNITPMNMFSALVQSPDFVFSNGKFSFHNGIEVSISFPPTGGIELVFNVSHSILRSTKNDFNIKYEG